MIFLLLRVFFGNQPRVPKLKNSKNYGDQTTMLFVYFRIIYLSREFSATCTLWSKYVCMYVYAKLYLFKVVRNNLPQVPKNSRFISVQRNWSWCKRLNCEVRKADPLPYWYWHESLKIRMYSEFSVKFWKNSLAVKVLNFESWNEVWYAYRMNQATKINCQRTRDMSW